MGTTARRCATDEGDHIYSDCPGDPELLSLPGPNEYARRFAFATLPQYPDTYLVLTRKKSPSTGSYSDVTLDCAGVVTGWTRINNDYETVSLPLSRGSFEPQVFPGGTCTRGAHTMTSDGLVTGQLWGWSHPGADDRIDPFFDGSFASYGFVLYGVNPSEKMPTK